MPDSPLNSALSALGLAAHQPVPDLLRVLLEVSLTGIALYRPLYDDAQDPARITDFEFVLLNPAALQILGLTEQPRTTYLSVYPGTLATGVFDFHCRAFTSGRPDQFGVNYQADGLDNYFQLSAQRAGELLVVSFTDTANQSRSAVEVALRESQAREQAARTEAEIQRNRLHGLFMQAPAMIAILEGPAHVFGLVTPLYQALVGNRPLLGRPIREAMPELMGQPIFGLLDRVYATGEIFRATEMQVQLDHENSGQLGHRYYNFIYQPTRDPAGAIDGILVFAYDVTEQVRARELVEHSEQQLAAANTELAESNAALLTANEAVLVSNNELERRVIARTEEVRRAQAVAEQQRARLEQLFMQAPAAICILNGPDLVYELVNPAYQQLFPDRQLQGRPITEALPEIVDHLVYQTFRQVYETGITHQEIGMLIPFVNRRERQLENRYFNYIQQARYNEYGQIDGILVFAFEVTEQVQARQLAERGAREFETLTNAISNLVWTATPAGEVDYCNQPWYYYTGTTPESFKPGEWTYYLHPHDLPYAERRWQRSVQTGEPYQIEVRVRAANGFYRWFLVRALPLRDAEGTIVRWFGTCTDVQEQKELSEALQLASQKLATTNKELRAANAQAQIANVQLGNTNEQLTRINQDLDNFVYTASHDLQQPVHNMAGIFQELKRTATFHDPDAEQLISMFEESLDQINRTIQGLTRVVQAERLTQNAPLEVVDLAALTQSVLQSVQSQATSATAQFEVDFAAVPRLLFGRLNLQSILYNLISNALKYAHPERTPRVIIRSALSSEGTPLLEVQDNGMGLDLQRFGPNLFQMFRRFHDHVTGSGLGLYLVNRIAQQAGGFMEVSSTVDVGTTFRLHMPASALPPEAEGLLPEHP